MTYVGSNSASPKYHAAGGAHQPTPSPSNLSSPAGGSRPQQRSFVISLPAGSNSANTSGRVAAAPTAAALAGHRADSLASSHASSRSADVAYFVDESSCLLDSRLSVAAAKNRKHLLKRRASKERVERAASWLKKWLSYMALVATVVAVVAFFTKLLGNEADMYVDGGIAYEWNELSESVFLVIPCIVFFTLGLLSYFGLLFCIKSSSILDSIEMFSILLPMLLLATPLLSFALDTVISSGLSRVDVHVLQAFAIFGAAFLGHPREAVFLLLLFRSAHCIEDSAHQRAKRAADAIETLAPTQAWVLDREALHSTTTVLVHTIPPPLLVQLNTTDSDSDATPAVTPIVGVSDAELLKALAMSRRSMMNGEFANVLAGLPSSSWVYAPVIGLEPGIIIRVKKGEIVPVKSTLLVGNAAVSLTQAHLDGETIPSSVLPGSSIAAGSVIVQGAPVFLLVTHKESEGELAELRRVLKVADENKPPIEDFFGELERTYSKLIILIVLAIALGFPHLPGLWAVPMWGTQGSIFRAIAFLVAGAPCALVLAAPIAYWSTATVYMQQAMSIADFSVIDSLAGVTDVIFDKTGTLTTDIRVADLAELDPATLGIMPILDGTQLGLAIDSVTSTTTIAAVNINRDESDNNDDSAMSEDITPSLLPDLVVSKGLVTLNGDNSLLRAVAATAAVEKVVSKQPHAMAALKWSESVLRYHDIALIKERTALLNQDAADGSGAAADVGAGGTEDGIDSDDVIDGDDVLLLSSASLASSLNPDVTIFPVGVQSLEQDTSGKGVSARLTLDGVDCHVFIGSATFTLERTTNASEDVIKQFLAVIDSQKYRGISLVGLKCEEKQPQQLAVQPDSTAAGPAAEAASSSGADGVDSKSAAGAAGSKVDDVEAPLDTSTAGGGNGADANSNSADNSVVARQLQEDAAPSPEEATTVETGAVVSSVRIFILAFKDSLRNGAVETIKSLESMGIKVHIVSGDSYERTQAVATEVGISTDRVIGGVSPEGKLTVVQSMRSAGKKVAMVGDESNDAAAMVASDVGMAIAEDASLVVMCVDVAKVVIRPNEDASTGGYLDRVAFLIQHAIKCRWIVAENLIVAFFGVLVVAPAAVMNKIPFVLAVLGHEGGTILVALNSLRLLSV